MTKNPWDVLKQGANVTVDVPIGSKCHCGRIDLGRFVKAPKLLTVMLYLFNGARTNNYSVKKQFYIKFWFN